MRQVRRAAKAASPKPPAKNENARLQRNPSSIRRQLTFRDSAPKRPASSARFTVQSAMANAGLLHDIDRLLAAVLARIDCGDRAGYRSVDFRFEEFLRSCSAHVRPGDKGYPGIDIG